MAKKSKKKVTAEDVVVAPPGKVIIPAPEGFDGYMIVPDPDGWLSAKDIGRWVKTVVPPSLQDEPFMNQEAFARSHMVEFHIEGWNITQDTFLDTESYPAAFAYAIVDSTEEMITKARSKKK